MAGSNIFAHSISGKPVIGVTFQDEALAEVRRKLADMEKRAPSVMANALNQTQTELKKYLPQETLKRYTYKRKLQKPRQQRASYKNLTATLFYNRKDPGLEQFEYSPGSHGEPYNSPGTMFAAKVLAEEEIENIDRAFIIDGKIFRREGAEARPIQRLFGPSEHSMINHVWNEEPTQEFTAAELSKKLDEQINTQFLKKWGMSTKEAKSYLAGK